MLQECELDPLLTVRETMTEFASFYPSPRDIEERSSWSGWPESGTSESARSRAASAGRLDVGVGIIGDPELLFLDEPTTGFDPTARRDAWNMIEGLRALGTTIVLTTHYMDEAQHLADEVMILREGQVVAEDRRRSSASSWAGRRHPLPDAGGVEPRIRLRRRMATGARREHRNRRLA